MAHAQKPHFVFRLNGRVHLNRRGSQFSRLLAAEVCASALVTLDTVRPEVVWEYWLPTPFASFPFTSPPVRHRVPSGFKRAPQQNADKYSYSFIFWWLQSLLELRRRDARSENDSLFAMYIIWLQTNKGPSQYTIVIDSIWIHCYQSDNLCIMMGLCCGEILSCWCYVLNSQTINAIPCIWRKYSIHLSIPSCKNPVNLKLRVTLYAQIWSNLYWYLKWHIFV